MKEKPLTALIAPSVKIWDDGDLISEMLANLLYNAMRHTPRGTQVEISLKNHCSNLVVSIAGNGTGVPHAERELIFRRFYRLKCSISTPGTGLGLSLVAAVAELHGMQFRATDNAPGLRVTLTFDRRALSARRPRSSALRVPLNDLAHMDARNCAQTANGGAASIAKLERPLPILAHPAQPIWEGRPASRAAD